VVEEAMLMVDQDTRTMVVVEDIMMVIMKEGILVAVTMVLVGTVKIL
jgi:hypothetical protein